MAIFEHDEIQNMRELVARLDKTDSADEQISYSADLIRILSEKLRNVYKNPSETIVAFIKRRGLNKSYLSKIFGSRSRASEILAGKRTLSVKDLRTLRENLDIPPDLLLDEPEILGDANFAKYPLSEMYKLGLLSKKVRRGSEEAKEAVMGFFNRAGVSLEYMQKACLRQTKRKNAKTDSHALQVWLGAVKIKAQEATTAPYAHLHMEDLRKIARYSAKQDGPLLAVQYLNDLGIKVVFQKHLKGTFLDGAVLFFDNAPVIGMTLRHDRLDNFWFTLFHELGHIISGHVKEDVPLFDDMELMVEDSDDIESQADKMALAALFPDTGWDVFATSRISTASICAFASEHSLSPAIVAGRWRFEKKNYKVFSSLVGHGEVRRLFWGEKENS